MAVSVRELCAGALQRLKIRPLIQAATSPELERGGIFMSSLGNAFDPGNYGQSSHLKLVIEEAGRECLTGFVQDLIIKFWL